MTPSRFLSGLAALIALAVVSAVFWFPPRGDAEIEPALPEPPAATATPEPTPAPIRTPDRPEELVGYPDGTYMPPLNGVTHPSSLMWPVGHPFTPIVGKRSTADGTWWYLHADGTCSTTMMVWRSDVGAKVAMTHVARPVPVAPVEPDERSRQ
jgi:hypothetical protein